MVEARGTTSSDVIAYNRPHLLSCVYSVCTFGAVHPSVIVFCMKNANSRVRIYVICPVLGASRNNTNLRTSFFFERRRDAEPKTRSNHDANHEQFRFRITQQSTLIAPRCWCASYGTSDRRLSMILTVGLYTGHMNGCDRQL